MAPGFGHGRRQPVLVLGSSNPQIIVNFQVQFPIILVQYKLDY